MFVGGFELVSETAAQIPSGRVLTRLRLWVMCRHLPKPPANEVDAMLLRQHPYLPLAGRELLSTRRERPTDRRAKKRTIKIASPRPIASLDKTTGAFCLYLRQRMVPFLVDNGRASWRSEAQIVEEVAKVRCGSGSEVRASRHHVQSVPALR
jgi:hypothetical protein